MPNNNAKKGAATEKRVAKGLGATRKAGPNRTDLKKAGAGIEVKHLKNPATIGQIRSAFQQNKAKTLVFVNGFKPETIEYAKTNMPRIQLRAGTKGQKLIKSRLQSK